MALKFLSDIQATAGTKDSSGDLGSNGQVLSSTGSDTNWVNPTVGTTVIYKDSFTATNGQTAFTLANTVDSEDKTQVYIDGAYQSKGGYTVSGTTLTFDTGLETSSEVEVMTFSTATANNAASAVKLDTFTGDGSDLTFVLSEAVVDEKVTQVYINGVYQNKSTYSIAADLVTLTFGSGNAPPNSSAIEVISFKTITSTDGTLTATTFLGDLNGTINTATTATTQSAGNNSTKISTTAYTDAKVAEAITNGTTGIAPSQDVVFDALALKSNLADPTFTGTVGGITKAMVGLSNVDNTTDALKPVSTAGQTALDLKSNIAGPTFTGDTGAANLTLSGYLRGPASFVIDPAAHGNNTGTLVVAGNLQVDGTTTTINSTTVSIDDLNFSIATDAADSAAANGAGITIGGAGASLTYSHSGTKFVLNKPLDVTGAILIQQSGSTGFTTEKTGGTGSFINLKDNAGSVFIGGVNSEFVVQTPGSSYSNKLTISSGGDATFSGNVSLADTKYIQLNNTSTDWRLRADNAGRFVIQTSGGSEFFKISSGGDTTITTTTNQGGLTITSATDNTTLRLINTATSGQDWRLYSTGGSSGLGVGKLFIKVGTTETAARLVSFVDGGSNIKVGIGTTSPSATLHVNAPATTAPSLTMGASAGQIFENEDLEFAFGLNNASPYNGWMQTRFNGNAARNLAINPLGGNVGIGTNSPKTKLDIYHNADIWHAFLGGATSKLLIGGQAGSGGVVLQAGNASTANNAAPTTFYPMLLQRDGGNVGIGTTSPGNTKLDVVMPNSNGTSRQEILRLLQTSQNTLSCYMYGGSTDLVQLHVHGAEQNLSLTTGGTASATTATGIHLRSGGNVGIGTLSPGNIKLNVYKAARNNDYIGRFFTNTGRGLSIGYDGVSNNTSYGLVMSTALVDGYHIGAWDHNNSGAFFIYNNGNIENQNNSYGQYSDIKLKENVVDASPKLDDLLKVKVKNFNFIGSELKQIGVIAQELEEVFPGLVEDKPDTERDEVTNKITELETTTKSVKYSVFTPMLIKAIQEQQTIIEDLKSRIETLEG